MNAHSLARNSKPLHKSNVKPWERHHMEAMDVSSLMPVPGEIPCSRRSVLRFYGRNPRGRNTSGRLLAYEAIPLFKCHSLRLQVYSDAAREVFPTRVTRGFITNSREKRWIFIHTFQTTCNRKKKQFYIPN
jgi:hypothetical protein